MDEKKSVFRKKSLDNISSPERLNEYIRVSTPGVWLILAAITVLLIGILVWSVFGTLKMNTGSGEQKDVHPISFVVN